MDISQLIQEKLTEFGLEQRDLADAANVTESYISQLLNRRKAPPVPERTDIYSKLGKILKLPTGTLEALAELQRREEIKRKIQTPPAPLFGEFRQLLLSKCKRIRRAEIQGIFEKLPFGELERFITQKLLDVVQGLVREELKRESWLRLVARESSKSYKQVSAAAREFLDADVFNVTPQSCVAFLDPLITSWDIDLTTFRLEIVLNRRIVTAGPKTFEFVEIKSPARPDVEPGLRDFLKDRSLSTDLTEPELEFLKSLQFTNGRRPTALYFYRGLQNLRDPLHFRQNK